MESGGISRFSDIFYKIVYMGMSSFLRKHPKLLLNFPKHL